MTLYQTKKASELLEQGWTVVPPHGHELGGIITVVNESGDRFQIDGAGEMQSVAQE